MIVIAANHLVADSACALHWDPAGPLTPVRLLASEAPDPREQIRCGGAHVRTGSAAMSSDDLRQAVPVKALSQAD
jgi:hypothetical protein